VIFRDAMTADIPAIVALVDSAYRGESSRVGWTTEADLLDGQRTDAEGVADIIATADSRLLLALSGHMVVACCHLERRGTSAYFGMFSVSPALQGGGVGRQVLTEAERIAREDWGAETMEMTVIAQRRDLIDWYVRRGYAETGETRPFPYGDERYGKPKRDDLVFNVLSKSLAG
jgi:GNAT superfamily N-acetyltransferase